MEVEFELTVIERKDKRQEDNDKVILISKVNG